MFFVLAVPVLASSSENIPSFLASSWGIGIPYDTPGPVGIDANQEGFIRTLRITYTTKHLRVCGKDIPIQSINVKYLTGDKFLQTYGFLSHVIGMNSSTITDVTINPSDGMNACGEYEDPGVHVLIDSSGHVVMEVGNDYFPLKKE